MKPDGHLDLENERCGGLIEAHILRNLYSYSFLISLGKLAVR